MPKKQIFRPSSAKFSLSSAPLSPRSNAFEFGSGVRTARERAFRRRSLLFLPLFSSFLCFFDPLPSLPFCCWFCFRRTSRAHLCSRRGLCPMRFQMVVESRRSKGQAWLLEKSAFWVVQAAFYRLERQQRVKEVEPLCSGPVTMLPGRL
ncbi:hypothetical protein N665_5075s0002 [Sinapis alba]|nr:hypothetical protein N665_5075s0002 [Sinapis alba]